MSFASPLFLLALAVVPLALLLAALARRRRERYAIRMPSVPTLIGVLPSTPRWRRALPTALLCLALAGLALALARPQKTIAVPVERASVMLVSDSSGSMQATDVSPSRLDAAREAAERFLDEVPDELQIGMVAFSDAPYAVARPTKDREQVEGTLAGISANGATATGDALRVALDSLPRAERGKRRPPAAVVLLSDGATTSGSDPVEAAREAARLKVPIYTVALGTDEGRIVHPDGRVQYVPPDRETLRQIAKASGGAAFEATDADALNRIYEKLGSQIGTRDEEREITAAFAAAGLVLLLAALVTSRRWTGRLP